MNTFVQKKFSQGRASISRKSLGTKMGKKCIKILDRVEEKYTSRVYSVLLFHVSLYLAP